MRVVVVGAGLFGSIIAAWLREMGHTVKTVADQRPGMGSVPAACLMKPSWASGMGGEYDMAIELLRLLYGVEEIEFSLPVGSTKCHWVDPRKVLVAPDIEGLMASYTTRDCRVQNVRDPWKVMELEFDHIVFATGQWASQEDRTLAGRLEGKGGWSFLFEGQVERPFITPWAPYKQLVGFNITPERVWVGDGSALKASSMTPERELASLDRCSSALARAMDTDRVRLAQKLTGFRPYVKGLKEPAYISQVGPRHTVVTGGSKNGTLGAAWAAFKIAEQIKCPSV